MSGVEHHAATAPAVSFVIPQKGRLDLLAETLSSIAAQRLADGPDAGATPQLEVVLVTQDEPSDGVRKLLEERLGSTPALRYRCIEEREAGTIATLRNRGARAAAGEILAFLDADVRLSENWTRALLEELSAEGDRVVVSAVQVAAETPSTIERIQAEMSRMKVGAVGFLSGHALMTPRPVFDATGGFPEHLATCEDYVFADRANALGTVLLSGRTSYVHLGEDQDYRTVFRKERWRARSNLASLVGRRAGFVELPSFLVPLTVLAGIVALPIALLAGSAAATGVALFLALAPPAAYTLRLLRTAGGRLHPLEVLRYYLAYFPARGLGLLSGVPEFLRSSRRP